MLLLRRPSPETLRSIAEQHSASPLTYDDRGATARGERPRGYRHDDEVVTLGSGDECWQRAVRAVREWGPHRGAGLVVSDGAELETESVVALAAPLPLAWVVAVCRVVDVVDEPDRVGFAYGTLPIHPETGEELFLVERDVDGTVVFRIVAFSRPHTLIVRIAGPVARLLQGRATRRYLTAMRRAVAA